MYKRVFLNHPKHHSVAFVLAQVEKRDVLFMLGDCNKQVCLDFDGNDKSEQRNALHKADLLIEVLKDFRAALAVEFARRNEK